MSIHTHAYDVGLAELLRTSTDSVDHRIADDLMAIDKTGGSVGLLGYLITLAIQDPQGTRPFAIAADMMRRLHTPDGAR